jgi:hypothetical protein
MSFQEPALSDLYFKGVLSLDRLCDLVVRVPGYRLRGPGSIPGSTSGSGKGSTQPHEYNSGVT